MKFRLFLLFSYLCALNKKTIFNKNISSWVNLNEL
jgi:hypothetical protein